MRINLHLINLYLSQHSINPDLNELLDKKKFRKKLDL